MSGFQIAEFMNLTENECVFEVIKKVLEVEIDDFAEALWHSFSFGLVERLIFLAGGIGVRLGHGSSLAQ